MSHSLILPFSRSNFFQIPASSRRRAEMSPERATNKLWERDGYGKTEEVKHTPTVFFLPDVEEVEGLCLLLPAPPSPSGAACISFKPPGSLQSPLLPHLSLHPPQVHSLPNHVLCPPSPHLFSPSCLLIKLSDESPRDLVHSAVSSSFTLSIHPFLIFPLFLKPLLSNACQPKKQSLPPLFLFSSSLLSVSSLNIFTIIDPPEWQQQRVCALLSSPVVHTILQHIIGATSQNLDFILVSSV